MAFRNKRLRANLALLTAAFFWGTTLIFQREVMANMTPLAYGGLRFSFGALILLPFAWRRGRSLLASSDHPNRKLKLWLMGGLASGSLIFAGTAFQQYGLVFTTASKAGFITSLYVVVVPLLMLAMGHKIMTGEVLGVVLAVTGLYFFSFTSETLTMSLGDSLVLVGAFIWAGQVVVVGRFSPQMDSLMLSASHTLVCGLLGLLAITILGQWPTWDQLKASWLALLWGGFFAVTLAYSLQVIGQKDASPATASIIMEFEAVVAAFSGWLILNEIITLRMLMGALLMMAGLSVSQLWPLIIKSRARR